MRCRSIVYTPVFLKGVYAKVESIDSIPSPTYVGPACHLYSLFSIFAFMVQGHNLNLPKDDIEATGGWSGKDHEKAHASVKPLWHTANM